MTADKTDSVNQSEEAISALWMAERILGQLGMWRQADKTRRIRNKVQAQMPVDPSDFIEVSRPEVPEGSVVLWESPWEMGYKAAQADERERLRRGDAALLDGFDAGENDPCVTCGHPRPEHYAWSTECTKLYPRSEDGKPLPFKPNPRLK